MGQHSKNTYYDADKAGSFVGVDKLYNAVRLRDGKITKNHVTQWLNAQYVQQIHKPRTRLHIQTRHVHASEPFEQWDADLMFVRN